MRPILVFSIALLACLSCQTEGPKLSAELQNAALEKLLGAYAPVFKGSSDVLALRVDPKESAGVDALEGHKVLEKGPVLTKAQKDRLQKLVFDTESYVFASSKRCPFSPELAFQFQNGNSKAHILICFSCNEWSFGNGKQGKLEDFDPVREELISLAKEVFPKYSPFQQLK